MHPRRYEVLKKFVEQARGSRQELIQRISNDISQRLDNVGITNRIWGREKHLYKIYQKMRTKDQKFHCYYGYFMLFRVIVNSVDDCYRGLGANA